MVKAGGFEIDLFKFDSCDGKGGLKRAQTFEFIIYPDTTPVLILDPTQYKYIYYMVVAVVDMGTCTLVTLGERDLMSIELDNSFSNYEFEAPGGHYVDLHTKWIQCDVTNSGCKVSISGVAYPDDAVPMLQGYG